MSVEELVSFDRCGGVPGAAGAGQYGGRRREVESCSFSSPPAVTVCAADRCNGGGIRGYVI